MRRLLGIVFCACALGAAVSSCGGGGEDAPAVADKLTIVGSGS